MSHKIINVAIGLIYQQGKILVGWRDESLHQGGCYEFPGGKVEPHEHPEQAVIRELLEETGIKTDIIRLFYQVQHDYSDRTVHLSFYLCKTVDIVDGELAKKWQFIALDELKNVVFPAANQVIVEKLSWGKHLTVCTAYEALPSAHIDLCYIKYAKPTPKQLEQKINTLSEQNIRVILNVSHYLTLDSILQKKIFAVHLNSLQLHDLDLMKTLDPCKNLISACHTQEDIQQANAIGCDAILLSPVMPTPTHPETEGMGWETFAKLAKGADMPVYALGGLKLSDLEVATAYGAYGVAGIRDFIESKF